MVGQIALLIGSGLFVRSLLELLRVEPHGSDRIAPSTHSGYRTRALPAAEDLRLLHIFVDADACPVKQEIYRVAGRCRLEVTLVANTGMSVPNEAWIRLEVVSGAPDAADDWIVEHVRAHDIVVTADILLAGRCLAVGSRVLGPTGKPFTDDNIGEAVATRELMAGLREAGERTGGPAPIGKRDRSRFLQQLDQMIQAIRRQTLLVDKR